MNIGPGVGRRIKKEIKGIDEKQPTGKEEDLFISISLSVAPSLELTLGPGYRKSLLLSSIVARTSPSETRPQTDSKQGRKHTQTQTKIEILFLQCNDQIQWRLNVPIWHHQISIPGGTN